MLPGINILPAICPHSIVCTYDCAHLWLSALTVVKTDESPLAPEISGKLTGLNQQEELNRHIIVSIVIITISLHHMYLGVEVLKCCRNGIIDLD